MSNTLERSKIVIASPMAIVFHSDPRKLDLPTLDSNSLVVKAPPPANAMAVTRSLDEVEAHLVAGLKEVGAELDKDRTLAEHGMNDTESQILCLQGLFALLRASVVDPSEGGACLQGVWASGPAKEFLRPLRLFLASGVEEWVAAQPTLALSETDVVYDTLFGFANESALYETDKELHRDTIQRFLQMVASWGDKRRRAWFVLPLSASRDCDYHALLRRLAKCEVSFLRTFGPDLQLVSFWEFLIASGFSYVDRRLPGASAWHVCEALVNETTKSLAQQLHHVLHGIGSTTPADKEICLTYPPCLRSETVAVNVPVLQRPVLEARIATQCLPAARVDVRVILNMVEWVDSWLRNWTPTKSLLDCHYFSFLVDKVPQHRVWVQGTSGDGMYANMNVWLRLLLRGAVNLAMDKTPCDLVPCPGVSRTANATIETSLEDLVAETRRLASDSNAFYHEKQDVQRYAALAWHVCGMMPEYKDFESLDAAPAHDAVPLRTGRDGLGNLPADRKKLTTCALAELLKEQAAHGNNSAAKKTKQETVAQQVWHKFQVYCSQRDCDFSILRRQEVVERRRLWVYELRIPNCIAHFRLVSLSHRLLRAAILLHHPATVDPTRTIARTILNKAADGIGPEKTVSELLP